ncbi:GNAT family N-acetyltransferase [Actinoplanes sp. NPDC049265]|uniref:GNAT family N-acetyltransferase n=1 Tax=Actinoplanes sp. NPDC049265 TaxID=3363902 RepID=UPI0037143E30
MSWHISGSVRDYPDRAGPFLRSRPVENTVPLTLSETSPSRGPHLYDGATDVVLFTDLANPTSNALYQRLGYRPVEDRKVVLFQ